MRLPVEKYKDALYRYSTGQGFNVNVEVPEVARQVAAYKMLPLQARNIKPGAAVSLKREADRLSMQLEAAHRQLMTIGYDPVAGKRYRRLKNMVDALSHLLTSYPIKLIKSADLDLIYQYFESSSPQINSIIQRVIKYNRGGSNIFTETALGVRKGYPLYDSYGKKLTSSGLGGWNTYRPLCIFGAITIAYWVIKVGLRSL